MHESGTFVRLTQSRGLPVRLTLGKIPFGIYAQVLVLADVNLYLRSAN